MQSVEIQGIEFELNAVPLVIEFVIKIRIEANDSKICIQINHFANVFRSSIIFLACMYAITYKNITINYLLIIKYTRKRLEKMFSHQF